MDVVAGCTVVLQIRPPRCLRSVFRGCEDAHIIPEPRFPSFNSLPFTPSQAQHCPSAFGGDGGLLAALSSWIWSLAGLVWLD